MTEAPAKPRTRKLKQDKPLTEAEEKEVSAFESNFCHILDRNYDVPDGSTVNGPALCGKKGPFVLSRDMANVKVPICPICLAIHQERTKG